MSTYKLIQNIEAEDKILGPLTLRQFIFGMITAFLVYINFILVVKHLYIFLILFVPPMLIVGFFALPIQGDQPTEIWALAKLRFLFKPRKRMWDQSGVKELVTITAPKKIERVYTDGLSQNEVQSRLKALANTIDSRGWATKNVNIDNYTPNPLAPSNDDRLLDISSVPNTVPESIISEGTDMLDDRNNPIARQFDSMIQQSTQQYRQKLVEQMNATSIIQAPIQQQATPAWFFMGGGKQSYQTDSTPVSDDPSLAQQIQSGRNSRNSSNSNMRTLRPLDVSNLQISTEPISSSEISTEQSSDTMTTPSHPAILALANNDDLNVSTIAREAKKAKGRSGNDEVIISLH